MITITSCLRWLASWASRLFCQKACISQVSQPRFSSIFTQNDERRGIAHGSGADACRRQRAATGHQPSGEEPTTLLFACCDSS